MTKNPIVPATDVRIARGEVVLDQVAVTDRTGKVLGKAEAHRVQSRLERMFRRKEIHEKEYAAGAMFAEDAENTMVGVKSCLHFAGSGDPVPGILESGSKAARASMRVKKAMAALGPALLPVVLAVAVQGKSASEWATANGYNARDGAGILRMALRLLITHYGLDDDCQSGVSK